MTIDLFDSSYRPILDNVQQSDEGQINFAKYNLEKLAKYMESTGKDLRVNADEINQAVAMISCDTDLRIFVDTHKSANHFLAKEEF